MESRSIGTTLLCLGFLVTGGACSSETEQNEATSKIGEIDAQHLKPADAFCAGITLDADERSDMTSMIDCSVSSDGTTLLIVFDDLRKLENSGNRLPLLAETEVITRNFNLFGIPLEGVEVFQIGYKDYCSPYFEFSREGIDRLAQEEIPLPLAIAQYGKGPLCQP